MSEQVWVKAERHDNGVLTVRSPRGSQLALQAAMDDSDVVPASELQRVTPSLPQTEEEWKQCAEAKRRVTYAEGRARTEGVILDTNETALFVRVVGDMDKDWDVVAWSRVTALDPPWVPEGSPEEEIVGWVNQFSDGTLGGIHSTRKAWAAAHPWGQPCKVVRVVAVGDGER